MKYICKVSMFDSPTAQLYQEGNEYDLSADTIKHFESIGIDMKKRFVSPTEIVPVKKKA